jgi:hypothetical protein
MSHAYLPPYRRDFGGACHVPLAPVIAAAAPYALAVSAAAGVAGAGIAYLGAQQSATAASNSDKYNAEVAANNQTMANQAASAALQQGNAAQVQAAYQENVLIGQQKAGLAANGIDVGSGTAVDLLSDTKSQGELDQLSITNNAQRAAAGFTNQGINYQNTETADNAAAEASLTAGEYQGASSLVTGAGTVASSWINYTRATNNAYPIPSFSSSPQAGGLT